MAFFCVSFSAAGRSSKKASGVVRDAVVNTARNFTKKVELSSLPTTLEELQAMPEAALTDEYAVAALAVAVYCNYEKNPNATCRMMAYLYGPKEFTGFDEQFVSDRLAGRGYVMRSYLKGATPDNNYTATTPYTVVVSQNRNSRVEKGYVKLFVRSSGADSPRPITLRKKPSTGQWFVWQPTALLTDVRKPVADDPWK